MKNAGGLFRVISGQYSSFRSEGHDGVFELRLSWIAGKRLREYHEGSRNDRHDHDGHELLPDTIAGFAMEFLDIQDDLFISVMGFDFPPFEIEGNELLCRKLFLVIEVSEEDGNGSIRTDQLDDSELNSFELLSLFLRGFLEKVAARVNADLVFLLFTLDEGLYGGERRLSRAAKYKVPPLLEEIADQLVAGVASVKEQHTYQGNELEEVLYFIALGRIHRDDGSGDGQASEDIVGGGDEALGIVAFSCVLEAALGIKLLPNLGRGRKIVPGPVHGEDRHVVPAKFRVFRPVVIGQLDGIIEYVSENVPVHFLARPGHRAVVDGFSFRPKAGSSGSAEEFTRFHINPLALSTGDHGEYEGDKLRKRKFSLSGKILG